MPNFRHEPELPSSGSAIERDGFSQTIQLRDGDKTLATALWYAPAGQQGVVQLIELTVDPSHCRHGLGSSLLREVIQQAISLHNLRKRRLRRIWVSVGQKTQVIARAFLTQHGFHHTATIKELLDHQDALVYVRTFD